jgi:excisionase family DNA binding protein
MLRLQGEDYMTAPEAARLLGVKPSTLYAYVSRGLIRSYRQGIKRQRLYRRADLEAMLQVVPSDPGAAEEPAAVSAGGSLRIPLAESWIRD